MGLKAKGVYWNTGLHRSILDLLLKISWFCYFKTMFTVSVPACALALPAIKIVWILGVSIPMFVSRPTWWERLIFVALYLLRLLDIAVKRELYIWIRARQKLPKRVDSKYVVMELLKQLL